MRHSHKHIADSLGWDFCVGDASKSSKLIYSHFSLRCDKIMSERKFEGDKEKYELHYLSNSVEFVGLHQVETRAPYEFIVFVA